MNVHALKEHSIAIALSLVIILIIISLGLSFYTGRVMRKATALQEQTAQIKFLSGEIFHNTIRNIDISIRGYALMREDRFLFFPPNDARETNDRFLTSVDSLLAIHHFVDSSSSFAQLRVVMNDYLDLYDKMVLFVQQDQLDEFKRLQNEDRGKIVWQAWFNFIKIVDTHEGILNQEAQATYERASIANNFVQILLLLIGLPSLGLVIYKLRKDDKNRRLLLQNLEENNRKYLFNPGTAAVDTSAEILETSIVNVKRASEFIKYISAGNYDQDFDLLNEQNQALNQENLVGELLKLREQMRKMKREDEKRLWITDGQARFAEIVRLHQNSLATLSEQALLFLIKYLDAQQGSLFVLRDEESELYLDLAACYAFNRKKHLQKRISLGQGLVGQTYLEGQTTVLTKIPQSYTSITSGLGDATPTCLLVVPAKYNGKVEAVVELAGFIKYEPHQIAFIEKAGEILASTLISVKNNEKMQQLLDESQLQAEQMRAQEEEMRQNMEELQATQEEMHRKERELREYGEKQEQRLVELQQNKAALEQKESELQAAGEKNRKRSQQYKEKMEALDTEIESKTSQINVLKKINEELLQKLSAYESNPNQ